ncbi:hypothetical protein AMTR_s00337p00012400 [Amborella trichopoda]|uniref:Condensin II complex subunit H2 N-terminal domain-containing protein n=1 Tax=Amborella trichopoda TaxID=13333 RepID=W1P7Z2_AMBTC|nr:hypothetical protein AMTR_s00337p00012400 [Amborella trichopoda]
MWQNNLKNICSRSVNGHVPINSAEAALLLQGSIQSYIRKVEYLYSLVLHVYSLDLHTLEFITQKRQDQQEKSSIHLDGSDADAIVDDGVAKR